MDYCEQYSEQGDPVLEQVERWAYLHTAQPQMVCGPYEGALLTILCRSLNAHTVVEIGTFVGYSTICMARGLSENGVVHTFEVNDELEDVEREHFALAGVVDKVSLHIGDAKELLPQIFPLGEGFIDLAFIDADKRSTDDYYEMLLPRMRKGGLIVVDNVLWGGKVLERDRYHDRDTAIIHSFNEKVKNDKRVENIILNVRDGLLICSVL
ncbi:MAG: O-methyltransferase [Bacteroidales bacterium]|nr:O-methyltransferase [Bacteroidales bacterium]